VVKEDHASSLVPRLAVLLLSVALLGGGTVALALADGGAVAAKKKCAKKRSAVAKKKCKKRKGATPPAAGSPAPTPAAHLAISPTSFALGTVNVAENSPPQTFTVTNSGPDAGGSMTSSLGGTDPSFYSISSDTCNGATLGTGSSCTLDVKCLGTSEGTKSATVTVTATPGGSPFATLTCVITT